MSAVGAAICALLVVAACGGYTPPTQAPTAAPSGAPTLSPAPSGAGTDDLLSFPTVACCRGLAIDAGTYELPDWLGLPFTVEVPSGWRVLNETAAGLFMLGRGANAQGNPTEMVVFLDASSGGAPEELAAAFAGAPQLTGTAPTTAIAVAGLDGLQVDRTALPNPEYQGDPQADIPPGVQFLPLIQRYFAPGFAWTTSSPEARLRTIWLTAGEQTLLIYLEAPPDGFDILAADTDAILGSMELIAP